MNKLSILGLALFVLFLCLSGCDTQKGTVSKNVIKHAPGCSNTSERASYGG